MRLYAFLLVAVAALHARAATIPVSETDKKLTDVVADNFDKGSENTSSEQELIDQANTIKDVDNKLRAKPEDIPVEVIVEDAEPAHKTDDEKDEEINRPVPDLRNPGPPQRQEHETQNPEHYASEQQAVLLFKQNVEDAQNVLRQGFQRLADGIQSMLGNNEPIQTLQQRILSLRDGFTSQVNKLNGTIQSYLNTQSSSVNEPIVDETKASFQQIEKDLFILRNDFNRGVSNLVDGVQVAVMLKADNKTPKQSEASSGSTSAPTNPAPTSPPVGPVIQALQNLQNMVTGSFQNWTSNWNLLNPTSSTTAVPDGSVQSDAQVSPATSAAPPTNPIQSFFTFPQIFNQGQTQSQGQFPGIPSFPTPGPGQLGSGTGPVMTGFNNVVTAIQSFLGIQGVQGTQPAPAQAAQTEPKPSETTTNKPEITPEAESAKPAASSEESAQAAAVTPAGPIRQILQNNPISKGIAGAVQRLQNINNPEKPRDVEQVKEVVEKTDEDKSDSESKKGGGPNTGDNNDSGNSSDRVEQTEADKEEVQKAPEVEKINKEEDIKEHKTEAVADKTE